MRKVVYTFWTGSNPMSSNRAASLQKMQRSVGMPVVLIDNKELEDTYCRKFGVKLHPAYYCLNLAHRADYLRAMFMHFAGGGYADIKEVDESWTHHFDTLTSSHSLYGIGYPEVSASGVADIYQSSKVLGDSALVRFRKKVQNRQLRKNYQKLIGCCAFIFKPNSPITTEWWTELNRRLDELHDDLQKHPSILDFKERPNMMYGGIRSMYPVPWTHLLGDILHPLSLKYSKNLSGDMQPPSFTDYE